MLAGSNLRTLREQLGLTMRDVETTSERLARKYSNVEFLIPISRLSDFETKGVIPSVYRLYSLAVIYQSDFKELLNLYDVDIDQTTSDVRSLEQTLPLTRVALAERTIGGRVILKRKIGQGSLSSVWDAVESGTGVRRLITEINYRISACPNC